ncbi:MAG: hypothetical protein VX793_01070 [Pseudomonadota bacterium]|nr:hypothetical protein [Pseudomonadota bacterium]
MKQPPTRILIAILILLGVFLLSKWLIFQTLLQPDESTRQRLPAVPTEAGQDTDEPQPAD